MASTHPSLEELAASISKAASGIADYLDQNGHPKPSFREGGLEQYPKDPQLVGLRLQLLQAASDIYHLALGPAEAAFMQPFFWNHDSMIYDIFNQFDVFGAVPIGGSATYKEISEKTTLPESIVRRLIRYSIPMRLFEEQPLGSGNVIHTATTAFLAKNPKWKSWLRHTLEEVRPGAVHVPESLKKYSAGKDEPCDDAELSGFALADIDKTGHPVSYWKYLEKTPEGKPEGFRAKTMAEAMAAAGEAATIQMDDILTSFDWGKFKDGTIVDVGGSSGHDSVLLAKAFPSLKFIVQDLPPNEPKFHAEVPEDLKPRVSYQSHDFFTPQPVEADVYFLKTVLHDWPTKDACSILRNLVPSMKAGARILLCESVIPLEYDEQGNRVLPLIAQKMMAGSDLQMLIAFNNLERSMDQWTALIKEADERLQVVSVFTLPGALRSIIEVELKA